MILQTRNNNIRGESNIQSRSSSGESKTLKFKHTESRRQRHKQPEGGRAASSKRQWRQRLAAEQEPRVCPVVQAHWVVGFDLGLTTELAARRMNLGRP